MRTSDLQINIIYTPGTARYLTPFVKSLLRWSDCRYRLISNGCSDGENELLQSIVETDERLGLIVMPEKRMVPHGETLDFLHERTDSDYFCFMDSDILAVGPFLEDFSDDLASSEVFSSCLPLWHNERDITLPASFKHMHGIHAYTDSGHTIACDYFVVYNNEAFTRAREETGMGLTVQAWQNIPPENQRVIKELGQQKDDYDSGKVLTMLMMSRGARVKFRQSDKLKHIGGFTEVGAIDSGALYSRGIIDNLAYSLPAALGHGAIHLADQWYSLTIGPKQNSHTENVSLASRIRRRNTTASYFYLLLVALMDDKPVPKVPLLGDRIAENRLTEVSGEIRELIKEVRTQPGPWQD